MMTDHKCDYQQQHKNNTKTRGNTHRIGSHVLLAEAEIGNLAVAVLVQQQVVQLEVAVDDVLLVQVLETQRHAGRIEAAAPLVKDLALDVHQQIAARRILHHKTDVSLGVGEGGG